MRYYTGVGSRTAPTEILKLMTRVARKLSIVGFTLRSGGAKGCDSAFASGSSDSRIYIADDAKSRLDAKILAKKYHQAWDRCNDYVQLLHARNCLQVLGDDLETPSLFLICWTPDGAISHNQRSIKTGGTGTAISIASKHNVPVFNLSLKTHFDRVSKWVHYLA